MPKGRKVAVPKSYAVRARGFRIWNSFHIMLVLKGNKKRKMVKLKKSKHPINLYQRPYLNCIIHGVQRQKFHKTETVPLLLNKQNIEMSRNECKWKRIQHIHSMHKQPTLLFLTWTPPCLIGPNFLNSCSSCVAVTLKGKFLM